MKQRNPMAIESHLRRQLHQIAAEASSRGQVLWDEAMVAVALTRFEARSRGCGYDGLAMVFAIGCREDDWVVSCPLADFFSRKPSFGGWWDHQIRIEREDFTQGFRVMRRVEIAKLVPEIHRIHGGRRK